ncbi:hypothetical protein WJ62_27590 [Burkholderia diffusa]|nr:hypothetical protein WJ62_27590 [Burkholderia diffusa]
MDGSLQKSAADQDRAASGLVAQAGDAHAVMSSLAGGNDREDTAALRARNAMAVKRDGDTPVPQIGGRLDDLATVIGRIAKLRHVATVFIFHVNLPLA